MAASKASRDQLMTALRTAGYVVTSIEADTRVSAEAQGLRCATMHRAKGLEFQNVIVTSTTGHPGDSAAVAPKRRKPKRPTIESKQRRLESKVKRGRIKALRGKVFD